MSYIVRKGIFNFAGKDQVVYAAYMPALGDEPNYAEVISAAKTALG